MTTIFCDNPGSCIEPGGYTLDDESWETECRDCGKAARESCWEEVEGGSINRYSAIRCGHCGHLSGNGIQDDETEYQDYGPEGLDFMPPSIQNPNDPDYWRDVKRQAEARDWMGWQ
ncbi:hypothetical protein [Ruegeria atlantica]|uniref:hypothetical protein n=1 Tax=Ruegeria atlantica TaxID=81569 RepID=UPI00147D7E65|nr:hypothetical protein [Ruegeria atlantica]